MRQLIFLQILFCLFSTSLVAQDTFSICAVDPATGQVGSAGATCISSSTTHALIISDVHPGVGVIHTQASYISTNQIRARNYMNMGYTPQMIIDSITAHDSQNNPLVRQYGVVSLDSGGMSAAYTGANCMNYKNHITGPTYSIQGNILLGQQILDSMEARFLNTSGNLACKLMAALQGAKTPGADTRCTAAGISAYSAFIRVANPGDTTGTLFLHLNANTYPTSVDPIDTLQALFDEWGGCNASFIPSQGKKNGIKIFPNPVSDVLTIDSPSSIQSVKLYNITGSLVRNSLLLPDSKIDFQNLKPGIYFLRIITSEGVFYSMKIQKT